MKYYVQFDGESVEECISMHRDGGGYDSVEEAKTDTFIFEEAYACFNVIDESGKSYGRFMNAESGVIDALGITNPRGI